MNPKMESLERLCQEQILGPFLIHNIVVCRQKQPLNSMLALGLTVEQNSYSLLHFTLKEFIVCSV